VTIRKYKLKRVALYLRTEIWWMTDYALWSIAIWTNSSEYRDMPSLSLSFCYGGHSRQRSNTHSINSVQRFDCYLLSFNREHEVVEGDCHTIFERTGNTTKTTDIQVKWDSNSQLYWKNNW